VSRPIAIVPRTRPRASSAAAGLAALREQDRRQDGGDEGEAHVEQVDAVPGEVQQEDPGQHGPQGQAQAGETDPDAHGLGPLVRIVEGARDERQAVGEDHRAAEPHDRLAGDQHGDGAGQERQQASGAHQQHADEEHPAPAEQVAEGSRRQYEGRPRASAGPSPSSWPPEATA
jgi:hypothetical protein